MPRLSEQQKKFLREATNRYFDSLKGSPAEEYLADRGLTGASEFALGYVADPLSEHERYRGMLAIPYLRFPVGSPWSAVSMRFRCITEGCTHEHHGRYNTVSGDTPRLYNTRDLTTDTDTIAVCEGEIDTITASINGIPAVGVAGATSWKPHFTEALIGYQTVFILADGDEAGHRFATDLASNLSNARVIPCDPGEDVNSEYVKHGIGYLKERLK